MLIPLMMELVLRSCLSQNEPTTGSQEEKGTLEDACSNLPIQCISFCIRDPHQSCFAVVFGLTSWHKSDMQNGDAGGR